MAWDGVPWFVGGGAEHSPEVARLLSYAAFGGAEGIVGPGDLAVKEQSVPDGSVRVVAGACSILNRAAGQTYQAYAARLPSEESVSIAATDGTGGRSDLIVARVEDPHLAGEGWAAPADPKVGPYVFTRVIPGVPAGTTTLQEVEPGQSGIALARIDIPASTGTITQAMITDLRALPRSRRDSLIRVHNHSDTGEAIPATFAQWPATLESSIVVPEWATHAEVFATLSGFSVNAPDNTGANMFGDFRLKFGTETTQTTVWNFSVPAGVGKMDTTTSAVGDDLEIPAAMRGTTQTLSIEAQKRGGSAGTSVETKDGLAVLFQVAFYEAPVA